jgi:hypothetical protein
MLAGGLELARHFFEGRSPLRRWLYQLHVAGDGPPGMVTLCARETE